MEKARRCQSNWDVYMSTWNERHLKEHTEQNHKAHFTQAIERKQECSLVQYNSKHLKVYSTRIKS